MPVAADRREANTAVRRDRGPDPPWSCGGPGGYRWGASRRDWSGRWTSCGGASPRATTAGPGRICANLGGTPAAHESRSGPALTLRRRRWVWTAPAHHHRRRWRAAAASVDDPERDRVPQARADPGVPDRRVLQRRRNGRGAGRAVRRHRLGRLRRRDRCTRNPAVQPAGNADYLITDRLLVISGVIVCWNFQLLPCWALAVLIARELAMLVLALRADARGGAAHQLAGTDRRGAGDGGVLLRDGRPADSRRGVAVYRAGPRALTATVMYARSGLAQLRASSQPV